MKFCREIQETLRYHTVKTEVSILHKLETVPGCDGRTDRHADRQKITIDNTRYS